MANQPQDITEKALTMKLPLPHLFVKLCVISQWKKDINSLINNRYYRNVLITLCADYAS